MHKVAEPGPGALPHLVLAATGLPEVSDGGQFRVHGSSSEPAIVQVLGRLVRVLFPAELDVDVADQVIAQVVAHVHLLDLSVLVLQLHEHVLEEVVVVLLHLLVGHVGHQMTAIRGLGRVLRVHVQILQQHRLREGGLVVDARAPVPVTAGSDFEVERAVDSVGEGFKWVLRVAGMLQGWLGEE